MTNSTKAQRRLSFFKPEAIISIKDLKGYGIYDLKNKYFVGFYTNRGLITVWNEAKKAKLAFACHTKNTIEERRDEYEVREIYVEHLVRG